MKVTFADTFFFIALLNARDAAHQQAVLLSHATPGRFLTTQWVLTEVADAFSNRSERVRFSELLQLIEADQRIDVIAATDELFKRGVELYRQRPDKDWPLTDCLSFVVMDEHGVSEALTGDIHFRQAGFTVLLGEAES